MDYKRTNNGVDIKSVKHRVFIEVEITDKTLFDGIDKLEEALYEEFFNRIPLHQMEVLIYCNQKELDVISKSIYNKVGLTDVPLSGNFMTHYTDAVGGILKFKLKQ